MTNYFFQFDMYINGREVLVGKQPATEQGYHAALRGFQFPASVEKRVCQNGSTRLEADEVGECLSWLVDVDEAVTPDSVIDLCMCLWVSGEDEDTHLVSEVNFDAAANPAALI